MNISSYEEYLSDVKRLMKSQFDALASPYYRPLCAQALSFILRPAKLLRPFLLLLICKHLGGDPNKASACGAAIELYHNATLIYDDVQDSTDVRRGTQAVHIETSTSLALCVAGLVRTLMYHPILTCPLFADGERIYIHGVLDIACTEVTLGQGIEMLWSYQERWAIDENEYLSMVRGKTGTLFSASAELGAFLAGVDEHLVRKMRAFGSELGILFQLKNDYLDLYSVRTSASRALYSDLKEGKRTLFIIRALRTLETRGDNEKSEHLKGLLSRPDMTPDDIDWCLSILEQTNSAASVGREITVRSAALVDNVEDMNLPNELRAELQALIQFVAAYDG